MNEAEFQKIVTGMCDELGLYHYHEPDSRRSVSGWPDLVIIGSQVLFRELKSSAGVLSHDQRIVSWKLRAARQDWAVWWPKDLHNGNIERQLRAIA